MSKIAKEQTSVKAEEEEEAESEVKVILDMENKLIINLINLYYVLLFYHSASSPPAFSSLFPLLMFSFSPQSPPDSSSPPT